MTKEAMKLALEALEHMLEDAKQERLTVEYWNECVDAITAIKQARSAPVQEPVAWPAGLIDRIKAAEQRIQDGHAPRRIPADPTDVDLVLAEVRYLLEGKQPPFWIDTTPPNVATPLAAQRQSAPDSKDRRSAWVGLTDEERMEIYNKTLTIASCIGAVEAKLKEKNT